LTIFSIADGLLADLIATLKYLTYPVNVLATQATKSEERLLVGRSQTELKDSWYDNEKMESFDKKFSCLLTYS